MAHWNFLCRKLMGLTIKGVFILTIYLVIINITSSHPRGGISQRELEEKINTQKMIIKRENRNVIDAEKKRDVAVLKPTSAIKEKEPFYKNIVIHFDLKGAPPKVPYFLELLRLIKRSGATGILLEWEDMFPWTGELAKFANTDAYSLQDVHTILQEARSLGLDVIPLVQTFGHLEWILKYEEMRKYRENDAYPQVICLGNVEAVKYVKEALRQVIQVHKDFGLKLIHIGADEAFMFGECKESMEWIMKYGADGGRQLLALSHLKNIAQFVKQIAGEETTVLAWHDMLKDFDSRIISKLDLGNYIEPVVWDYSEDIVTLNSYIFSMLASNFPTMWASSAYKGANYPAASFSEVGHYEKNNNNWIVTKINEESKFTKGFHGIIITGWQRYDHLAGLCETLPNGTPSLILQLQIAKNAPKMNKDFSRNEARKYLGCKSFNIVNTTIVSNSCNFTGFNAYLTYHGDWQNTKNRIETDLSSNHHLMGWANRYNRKFNISQNWYHREMSQAIDSLLVQYRRVERNVRNSLKDLFFDNTIDEFVYEYLGELKEKLETYSSEIQRLDKVRAWPKRNFRIE